MKIGIIRETSRFALEGEWREHFELHNFSISTEELSLSRIFYSAFATPARYLMELFRRLQLLDGSGCTAGCFLFNPFLNVDPETVQRVMLYLPDVERSVVPVVVTDRKNFPIGYFLPSWLKREEEHFLTLLSTVDGRLDQQLLNALFFSKGAVCSIVEIKQLSLGNGFFANEDICLIYKWTAFSALSLLNRLIYGKCTGGAIRNIDLGDGHQLRALRNAIPFSAVMPHHAGDVLFYALAARDTISHITRIVVNRRYVRILEDVIPDYGVVTINPPPPYRDGNIGTDEQCFIEFAPDLSLFSFHYYCRQVRDYNVSQFHLIDHFGFALGQSFLHRDDLITLTKTSLQLFRPTIPVEPLRVILHFDAGWGLKIYPEHYQKKLIQGLLEKEIYITVLGTEDRDYGAYRSVKFTNFDDFKDILHSHHLLVGSDSFPSHYAAHVLGLPTICLFGPTKPVNSDARPSDHYHYLESGLKCRPCGNMEHCHIHGKSWCSNFVTPERLLQDLFAMLEKNYGGGIFRGKG